MLRRLCAFRGDAQGGVALVFALAAPVLLGSVAATVTYGQLTARRAQLQNAADSAVLAATRELTLANAVDAQVISVAKTAAISGLSNDRPFGTDATPAPIITKDGKGQRSGVEITITETVETPFGKILSFPTSTLVVKAGARLSGGGKVCMIGLEERVKGAVHLKVNAQITATGCSLYSNSKDRDGLIGEDNAAVVAALVCSSGGVKEGKKGASFQPAPVTDCPALPDPLTGRAAPSYPGVCTGVKEVKGGSKPPREDPKADATVKPGSVLTDKGSGVDLSPGLYCDGLKVHGGAKVRLKPGVYVMRGPLIVDASSLIGQNVGFYFEGDKASLLFDTDSSISLTAPKDGDMAGLLMFEERRVSYPAPAPGGKAKGGAPPPPAGTPPLREYRIISDDAQTLLGTIYLPSGRLIIDSKKPVAAQSAYTVIVARLIQLFDGPNLVLNTNYGGTDIRVPKGLGPIDGSVSLAR